MISKPVSPVRAFFAHLNTEIVGMLGVLSFFLGFLARPDVADLAAKLVPQPYADHVSQTLALLGLALAYFGRPRTATT